MLGKEREQKSIGVAVSRSQEFYSHFFSVDVCRTLAVYPSLFAYRRNIGRDINTLLIINEIRRTAPRNLHWAHSIAVAI